MRKFEIAVRVSGMLADAMVLLAIWRATGGIRQLRVAQGLDINVPFTRLLLRDGTLYFFALFLINALVLALYISPVSPTGDNMALLCEVATTVLLSRLLLNLREVGLAPSESSTSVQNASQTSNLNLRIARALSPLGNSVIDGMDDDAGHRVEDPEGSADIVFQADPDMTMKATRRSSLDHASDIVGSSPRYGDPSTFAKWSLLAPIE